MNDPEGEPGKFPSSSGDGAVRRSRKLNVPPLIVLAACATSMWGVSRRPPKLKLRPHPAAMLAALIAGSGVAFASAGVLAFRRHHTTIDPTRPELTSQLVTTGPYAMTRNPMYLGMALILVAWAVRLMSPLAFAFVPAFVAFLNRFQIVPEERAMRALFGGQYVEYQRSVRRWL